MLFWKRKEINSKEYLELKRELALIWIEIDVLASRYKRKVTKKQESTEETTNPPIDDGFDELRKLNKEHN